mgnify:FL=1
MKAMIKKKEDARSKRDLANSLEKLLELKNYDDITIKEICENALVSKLTFYNNFYDKNELLKFLFARYVNEITSEIDLLFNYKKDNKVLYKDIIRTIIHYFYKNKERFSKVIQNDRSHTMFWNINLFINDITPLLTSIYDKLIHFNVPKEILSSYYVGAFANILYTTNEKDLNISEEKMTEYIYNLTLGLGIKIIND